MKAIMILLVLVGLGIGAAYYLGGGSSFDPDAQGRQAKAAIKPGMTWTQVIKVAGDNPRLQTISVSRRKIGGQMTEEPMIGPMVDFSVNKVTRGIKSGDYKEGFILHYMFSEQVCFDVTFDGKGVATSIEDARTAADLLGTRQRDE